jgi:hypothetical protein
MTPSSLPNPSAHVMWSRWQPGGPVYWWLLSHTKDEEIL